MTRQSPILTPLTALCCVTVLYVLSIGPAMKWTGGSAYHQNRVVRTVWRPVLALDRTQAQPIYRAYLRLWRVREPVCVW